MHSIHLCNQVISVCPWSPLSPFGSSVCSLPIPRLQRSPSCAPEGLWWSGGGVSGVLTPTRTVPGDRETHSLGSGESECPRLLPDGSCSRMGKRGLEWPRLSEGALPRVHSPLSCRRESDCFILGRRGGAPRITRWSSGPWPRDLGGTTGPLSTTTGVVSGRTSAGS